MKSKTLFSSLVYILTYRQSYQQLDSDICWGTRLYDGDVTKYGYQQGLIIKIDECLMLCKQESTCEAVTFVLDEESPACYPFKPNRYSSGYDQPLWASWFKKNTPSFCQTQIKVVLECKMPEEGKIYLLINYFGCPMELNDGHVCSGNEIVVSKTKTSFATSQHWYIKQVTATPNVYQIVNYHSRMALDTTELKLRQQIALSASKNQHFSFSFWANCSMHIQSVSNGTVLSNVGLSNYCLSKVYVRQDLRHSYDRDRLWYFKEVNLTTNDPSLNIIMTNSTMLTLLSKEKLIFLEPEKCQFPIEGVYYNIVSNRYQCAIDLYERQKCPGNLITTYVNYNHSTTNSNLWYIKKIETAENAYQIINANSRLALDSNENVLRQQISSETAVQQHYTFSFGPRCLIYIHAESNPNMVLSNEVTSPNCENKAAVLLQQKDNSTNQQWYFKEAGMNDSIHQRLSKNLIFVLVFSVFLFKRYMNIRN